MTTTRDDHICAKQAVCFRCFKAGMDRVRARREAWAQRSLPFDQAPTPLTARAVAHRRQMLAYLESRIPHPASRIPCRECLIANP